MVRYKQLRYQKSNINKYFSTYSGKGW